MLRHTTRISLAALLLCAAGFVHAAAVDFFSAPSGGEVYVAGQLRQVHISRGAFKSNVLVEISADGGKTFSSVGTIAAPSKTNTKEFELDFVVSATPSSNAILRASSTGSKGKITILSQPFIITTFDISAGIQVANGGVGSLQLADGSVTTVKLADGAVTAVKMSSGQSSAGFVLTSDGTGNVQYLPVPPSTSVANGSVTNASVSAAAAIAYSKLSLANSITSSDIKDGTIVDADVSPSAAIAYGKLNLTNNITTSDIKDGTIVDADISPTAAIQYSKLNLNNNIASTDIKAGAIADVNISPTAAIQYSKLNLFGSVAGSDLKDGEIINSKIAPNAAIQYSKLALANSIVNADVSPTAAIAYSKLNLTNSVLGGDLAPGTVTLDKISTAGAQMNQSIVYNGTALVFGGGSSSLNLPIAATAANTTTLLDISNTGDGVAGSFAINANTALSNALVGKTTGSGAGVFASAASGDGVLATSATGAAVHGKKGATDTGNAGLFENLNTGNASEALLARSNSSGLALHAIANGTGSAATFESSGATNSTPVLNISSLGTGTGLSVSMTNAGDASAGINVTHSGTGDAISGTSAGGNGVTGTTTAPSTTFYIAGVEGDNNSDGPGVLGVAGTGFGAVLGINVANGAGVEGYSLADGGFGIYGFGGLNSTLSIAGHFENRNAANTANTVEVVTNAATPGVFVNNTAVGGTALKVTKGAVSLNATTAATFTVVDNGYLVATTAGPLALPTAAPLMSGTTVWVVNNSGGSVSVTNANNGPVTIANGNAKQFVFISTVSATNWIPVQ